MQVKTVAFAGFILQVMPHFAQTRQELACCEFFGDLTTRDAKAIVQAFIWIFNGEYRCDVLVQILCMFY